MNADEIRKQRDATLFYDDREYNQEKGRVGKAILPRDLTQDGLRNWLLFEIAAQLAEHSELKAEVHELNDELYRLKTEDD